jgi:hypothetical protein
MGQHNLELAKQWDWESISEKTFNIYNRVLEVLKN